MASELAHFAGAQMPGLSAEPYDQMVPVSFDSVQWFRQPMNTTTQKKDFDPDGGKPTIGSFIWYVVTQWRVTEPAGSSVGDDGPIFGVIAGGGSWSLAWEKTAAGKFKVKLMFEDSSQNVTEYNSSSETFDFDTTYSKSSNPIRWTIQDNGGSERSSWHAVEIGTADTYIINQKTGRDNPILNTPHMFNQGAYPDGHPTYSSTEYVYCGDMALVTSSDKADRPDFSDLEIEDMMPNGDGTYEEAGQYETDLTDVWKNVDDYITGNSDDGTTRWRQLAETDARTTSTLTGSALTPTPRAVMGYSRCTNVSGTKAGDPTFRHLFYDGSTDDLLAVDHSATSYTNRKTVRNLNPSGGAWTDTILDSLEFGMQLKGGPTKVATCSEIACEAIAFSLDSGEPPNPVTTTFISQITIY